MEFDGSQKSSETYFIMLLRRACRWNTSDPWGDQPTVLPALAFLLFGFRPLVADPLPLQYFFKGILRLCSQKNQMSPIPTHPLHPATTLPH
jgi:hypothetical protein